MKEKIKKHPVIFSLLLYTVLFAFLYILSVGDNVYMYTEISDIANQAIPQAIRLKRFYTDLLAGDPACMDYNILFGFEPLFSFGLPLNPLNFILFFLPDSAVIMWYIKIVYMICMYAAGIGFIQLCRDTRIKPGVAAVSALLYIFTPYLFGKALLYYIFAPAITMFPFMIDGMERIFQRKSIRMLLVSSFISVLVNGLYMFVYLLVLTVIYAFVKVIFMKESSFFKSLWRYGWRGGFAVIAGICAAAAAVIPQIIPVLNSTRVSQVRHDVIDTAFTPNLFSLSLVFSNNTEDHSLGFALVPLVIVFVVLKGAPGLCKILLGLCALAIYIPVFPALMCTFTYIEHRWAFAFTLIAAWCAAYVIQNIGEADLPDRIISGAAMVIYMLCVDEITSPIALPLLMIFFIIVNIPFLRRYIDRFLIYIDSKQRYILEVIVYLVLIVFTVIMLAVNDRASMIVAVSAIYLTVTVCCLENRVVKIPYLFSLVPLAVLPVTIKLLFPGLMIPAGDMETIYDQFIPLERARDADMAAGDEIVRFESSEGRCHSNISLSRELAVTSVFVNLIPQRFADMLSNAGFDNNTHTALNALNGFEHRLPLMSVWGIDYIHSEKEKPEENSFLDIAYYKKNKAVPSAFEKKESFIYNDNENELYKNPYSLPFGFTYDSCITESDRQEMSGADYGINMMYSAALENDAAGITAAEPVSFAVPCDMTNEMITYDELADITYTRYTLIPEEPVKGEVYLTLSGIDVFKHRFGTVTVIINDDMERSVLGEFGGTNSSDFFNWFTFQDSYTFCCSTYDVPVEKVEVRASCDFEDMQLTIFPLDSYKQQFEKLSEYTLQNTVLGSDEITGSISVPDERILCLQLLYGDGWKAYDNGVPTEIIPVNGCMTGLRLSPGEHDIRLVYHVPGLAPGMAVSAVTVVILAVAGVVSRKRAAAGSSNDSGESR